MSRASKFKPKVQNPYGFSDLKSDVFGVVSEKIIADSDSSSF